MTANGWLQLIVFVALLTAIVPVLGGYMARVPWGRAHHRRFAREFAHTVSLTVTAEDLPEPDNRVTLDAALHDASGVPAPRLSYRLSDNSRRILDHGIARASEALRAAGAVDVVVNPLGWQQKTFGLNKSPADSVDGVKGLVYAAAQENEFALEASDGGLFVTSGAVNPTPTIQALALRSADHIAARLKEAR